MNSYRDVLIETYRNINSPSSKSIRARPVTGQGLDTSMNVECSSSMRKSHPVGTKFILRAKITTREGGTPFIYSRFDWPYRVVSEEEAEEFLRSCY